MAMVERPPPLRPHLEQFVNNSRFADLTLFARDGSKFSAHKIVIGTRVPFLLEHPSPSESMRPDTLGALLFYAYTDDVPDASLEVMADLTDLSDTYFVERLQRLCLRHVRRPVVLPRGTLVDDLFDVAEREVLTDVSLVSADGLSLRAHRIMLWRIASLQQDLEREREVRVQLDRRATLALWQLAYQGELVGSELATLVKLLEWSAERRDTFVFHAAEVALARSPHLRHTKDVCHVMVVAENVERSEPFAALPDKLRRWVLELEQEILDTRDRARKRQ